MASSPASAAGNGTERRSHDFGVLHCRPPDSVTDRDTFTRRRSMSKSCTRNAAISPQRRPVYARMASQVERNPEVVRFRIFTCHQHDASVEQLAFSGYEHAVDRTLAAFGANTMSTSSCHTLR